MSEKKDVLIFLYKTDDRNVRKFMGLFEELTKKLSLNENLHLFRCNIDKNEVTLKLGFQTTSTPALVFFRNRMK